MVPFLFLLIGVEVIVALWERKRYYRLHESINDLSCGGPVQILGIFLERAMFEGYQGTYAFAAAPGPRRGQRARPLAGRVVGGGDRGIPGRGWRVPLVPPDRPRVQPTVGRARDATVERGLQIHRGAAAAPFPGPLLLGLLPAAALRGPPLVVVRRDVELGPAVSVPDPDLHNPDAGPARMGAQLAVAHRVRHARDPRYPDRDYAGTQSIWDGMFGKFHRLRSRSRSSD